MSEVKAQISQKTHTQSCQNLYILTYTKNCHMLAKDKGSNQLGFGVGERVCIKNDFNFNHAITDKIS